MSLSDQSCNLTLCMHTFIFCCKLLQQTAHALQQYLWVIIKCQLALLVMHSGTVPLLIIYIHWYTMFTDSLHVFIKEGLKARLNLIHGRPILQWVLVVSFEGRSFLMGFLTL